MGFRSLKRQIAKARLRVMGVGNVNSVMSAKKGDMQNWKRALYGKTGEEAHKAQMNLGKLIKARDEGKKAVRKRKLKKVTA